MRSRNPRKSTVNAGTAALGLVMAVALSLPAFAINKGVALTGAGATFPLNIIQQWAADVKKADGYDVNYSGVGSGAGRSQYIAGTVDFAGSDVVFSAAEVTQARDKRGDFVYIPETAGGVSLMYNLPGLGSLKLSAPTIAKIFKGSIKDWNDAAITSDNGGVPASATSKPIQVFVRSDSSGTSNVFTSYMSATAPADWTTGPANTFPTSGGQIGKAGSDGVANAVKATDGGIGYAEASFAVERSLPSVLVKNESGSFVGPTAGAVTDAIDQATLNSDGSVTLNFKPTKATAYPISTVSYIIAPTKMDSAKGENLKAFLTYAIGDGQSRAAPLNYAPLPLSLVNADRVQIAKINPATPAAASQTLQSGSVADPNSGLAAAPAATTAATSAGAPAASGATGATTSRSLQTAAVDTATGKTGGADIWIGIAGALALFASQLRRLQKPRPAS